MYKTKEHQPCEMPEDSDKQLSVLVLNASLKHGPEVSNTEELAQLVLDNMKEHKVTSDIIRLADKNIPVGLGFKESDDDDWPSLVEKLKKADIVIFATPIWWGGRSSLMQRIIERMDALDEEYLASGRSALLNKVAGIVITGSEDGAQATLGSIMEVLTFMNFTLPPECCAYWVGEVGQPPKDDRAKRLKNEATQHMAKNLARNLVYYAKLLNLYPMKLK
jgi:multimeric flavodoxin WrbA